MKTAHPIDEARLGIMLNELRLQHPACQFDLQTAAGENPRVTALLAQLAIEAIEP